MSKKKSSGKVTPTEEDEGVPTSIVMLSPDDRAELIWLVRAGILTLCKVLAEPGTKADPEQIFDGYVVEHFGADDGVETDPDDIPDDEVIDDE